MQSSPDQPPLYRIVTGQKAYSSWSLRGWLLLAAFDLPFEDVPVRLYQPEFERLKRERAPARTVPILEWQEDGQTQRIWDTLAIAETLAERHPDAGHWPALPRNRAVARILTAEMHAGFAVLRARCPMNFHRRGRPLTDPGPELAADVARAGTLWAWALDQTGGPWLGGPRFSVADAFYAPLASRLESYGLIDDRTAAYADRLLTHASVAEWAAAGRADPERIALYEEAS